MHNSRHQTISIIIPNYNGESYLPTCLGSLLEQSFKGLEIILVDNDSSDGSVSLVKESYPDVVVVRLQSNRGYSAAVNAGIDAAHGEFVVLLNNDTEADAEFVRELHSALLQEPAASMAAPKMLFARDRRTINSLGLGYSITGANHDIGFGLEDGVRFDTRRWVFGPCGGAGMYRRSLFEEVGPFDEDFFMYYEDVDFSFRAQLAGHRCMFVPTARVYHAEGGSVEALPRLKNYYFARNSIAVIVKDFPRGLILRHFHVISWEIAKRIISPLLRADVSALRGYLAALGLIGDLLKKRRKVQERMKVPESYIETILIENRSVVKEINLRGRPVEELP